jgi:uncharacterized protein YgbK (DUF1537 family)
VVADDFTGANDTGVQLSKEEPKVKVVINTYHLNEEIKICDVLVPLLIRGTAFDIAWKGIAKNDSLLQAIFLAEKLAL